MAPPPQNPSAKIANLNREEFVERLANVPDDAVLEMASDGVISEQEIERLFKLMKLTPAQIQALKPHLYSIAKLMLRYASDKQRTGTQQHISALTGKEAVAIMQQLLRKGLIDKAILASKNNAPPLATPSQKTAKDKGEQR